MQLNVVNSEQQVGAWQQQMGINTCGGKKEALWKVARQRARSNALQTCSTLSDSVGHPTPDDGGAIKAAISRCLGGLGGYQGSSKRSKQLANVELDTDWGRSMWISKQASHVQCSCSDTK